MGRAGDEPARRTGGELRYPDAGTKALNSTSLALIFEAIICSLTETNFLTHRFLGLLIEKYQPWEAQLVKTQSSEMHDFS